MIFRPGNSIEELRDMEFRCLPCGWEGTGRQATINPNDLVRCPKCDLAVERKNTDASPSTGTESS